MQMVVFEQLKMAGLLCSRYSATVQKGRRFFTLAGKDMELPNGKGGKKKAASKRQRAASPAAPALDGGSPVEGEMAGKLLAEPGPSGMCAGSGGSEPSVPAGDSAAALIPAAMEPTVVELVVTELPPAIPAVEPGRVQPDLLVSEPAEMKLSVPAAQAAAAASAAETAMTVRRVSEALSVLALELAADGEPAAGVSEGVPAAVEPAAATVAASAAEPAIVEGERPVLANGPAAASKECWVLNPAVGPKVILRKFLVGPTATAAETAASSVKCAGELVPGSETPPAARQAAWETESLPAVMASGPLPRPVKRKAKAGVTGGSQKRKKSSPAKAKDS
jgi:hypothetical protein